VPTARVELIVFAGLQASGKTSFYRARFAATHLHVSKDAWPNARHRERRQRRLVEDALGRGQSVVVDNTNPSPLERRPLIELGRAAGARIIAYWFVSTVADAMVRNAARTGRARVKDAGIFTVAGRLVTPAADEGFDDRFEVRLAGDDFVVTDLR
jgi:predicted kinase